jgi:hypothetical protein
MKEMYIQSRKSNVTTGNFTELNQASAGIKKGDTLDVVFTDPLSGENLIQQCILDSVSSEKIGLRVMPHGYTEVSNAQEIFLMGIPENYPVSS